MRQHDRSYRGVCVGQQRAGTPVATGLVSVDGRPVPAAALAARLAPEGYAWGAASNGTRALAHALLSYEFDKRTADAAYEAFAREVIANLPTSSGGEAWRLTSQEVRAWLEAQQRTAGAGEQG